jgi:hypothetical protein
MGLLIGTWIAAFLTLAILSFLYKDNPVYKAAEHLYIGISAGYWLIYIYFFDVQPMLIEKFKSETGIERWILLVPAVLGALMLSRLVPKYSYISRTPIAFTVGIGAGLGITAAFQGFILPQMRETILPLVVLDHSTEAWLGATANNIVMVVGVLATLIYFYFSKPHTGLLGHAARLGIVYIMVAFGAAFGYTFMGRVSLLIGRVYFLIHDWLGLI